MEGYIKLYRQLKDSDVFKDTEALKIWIFMLLEASHTYVERTVKRRMKVQLFPGQLLFGRPEWSSRLNIKESKIYRTVKWFEDLGMISVMATKHYSVITIINWSTYQGKRSEHQYAQQQEQQNEQQKTLEYEYLEDISEQQNKQQTNNKGTHNKNEKNVKKKEIYSQQSQEIFEFYMQTFKGYYKRLTLTPSRKTKILSRLENGFTVEEIKEAIGNIRTSKFHLGEDGNNEKFYATLEFICRNDETLEKWINHKPKDKTENADNLNINEGSHKPFEFEEVV